MKKQLLSFIVFSILSFNAFAQISNKIARVLEYRPAPGQHINRLFPTPEMSSTPENALRFAENSLIENNSAIGLGTFGGYVIVGFDHPIVNVKGEYDLQGLGNASPNGAEPGIVMVCQDLNKNGKPDSNEPWYELAGSEYNHPETIKDYVVTYYRPQPDGEKSNITWKDNQGNKGEITHINFAPQATIYPLWIAADSLTFKGNKLRETVYNDGIYRLPAFEWGYVDNQPNSESIDKNGFKIDWAVDSHGNQIDLNYIDFVKVYTAQLQEAGWLGETSTDFRGIVDMHPYAQLPSGADNTNHNDIIIYLINNILTISGIETIQEIEVFALSGEKLLHGTNTQILDVSTLPKGVYVVRLKSKNRQLTKKIIVG